MTKSLPEALFNKDDILLSLKKKSNVHDKTKFYLTTSFYMIPVKHLPTF